MFRAFTIATQAIGTLQSQAARIAEAVKAPHIRAEISSLVDQGRFTAAFDLVRSLSAEFQRGILTQGAIATKLASAMPEAITSHVAKLKADLH